MHFDSSHSQREDLLLFCFTADRPGTLASVGTYQLRHGGEEASVLPGAMNTPDCIYCTFFTLPATLFG